jgi:hypothetical protein
VWAVAWRFVADSSLDTAGETTYVLLKPFFSETNPVALNDVDDLILKFD